MNQKNKINQTASFVKKEMSGEGSGHDWWHVYRVWQLAKKIVEKEKGIDGFVVELAALLHDIADWKFNNGDDEAGPLRASKWLKSIEVDEEVIIQVAQVIREVSFKGGKENDSTSSLESSIVQDADRLDAMGAIGVGRAFAYGGYANRIMYDPDLKPKIHKTANDYKSNTSPTINHFYEKLLLLRDRMKTKTGKQMAQKRHKYMEDFLEEFYGEWEGEF